MNIQSALLPHKHVRFCESLVALAGYLRPMLSEPRTTDELWSMVQTHGGSWPNRPSFTQVILALDVLFAIGELRLVEDERLRGVGQ